MAQIAEPLPIAREVSRQEKHHQNLDRFEWLKRSQVDFLVACAGTCAEAQQQAEQREGGQQGRVDEIGQALVIERAHQRQQQQKAAQKHTQGEFAELERVAQGVAQADHQDETDAGEQMQRRQDGEIGRSAAGAPGEPNQVEAAQVDG